MNAKGINSIDHPDCNTKVLGITSKVRARVIDQILDINKKSQTDDLVRPLCIKNNLQNWQTNQGLDYYVDFETINYNLFVDPIDMDVDNSFFDSDVSFMIGFGFAHNQTIDSAKLIESLGIDESRYNYIHKIDEENGWEFICLYLVKFEVTNELELLRLFFHFVLARGEIYKALHETDENNNNIKSRLFHWTDAELRFMRRAIDRIRSGIYTEAHMRNPSLNFDGETVQDVQNYLDTLINTFEKNTVWIDMYKVFENEPIVVKGSYRFKLKHIGNAFHNNGLIETKWEDGKMSDGFRAMLEAIKLYRNNQTQANTNNMYREIIDYNEIDCKVIWEIVNYLRADHCVPQISQDPEKI